MQPLDIAKDEKKIAPYFVVDHVHSGGFGDTAVLLFSPAKSLYNLSSTV